MKNTVQTTSKIHLYARFSSAEQADGCSERDQIQQAKSWCESRGLTLSEPYFIGRADSADTGGNRDEGTEFHKMIQAVRPGDKVLLRDNDRFGRDNALKALSHLKSIVEEKQISFAIRQPALK